MPKIKKVAVEAAKKFHAKFQKEELEKILKIAFALPIETNPEEESKEGENNLNYDEKKFKTMVDLITPKHSHLKKQATGVPKKDFRSFLKKQKVQA